MNNSGVYKVKLSGVQDRILYVTTSIDSTLYHMPYYIPEQNTYTLTEPAIFLCFGTSSSSSRTAGSMSGCTFLLLLCLTDRLLLDSLVLKK